MNIDLCGITKISLLDLTSMDMNDTAHPGQTAQHPGDSKRRVSDERNEAISPGYEDLMEDWTSISTQYPGVFNNWNKSDDILVTLASLNASTQLLDQIEARIANGEFNPQFLLHWQHLYSYRLYTRRKKHKIRRDSMDGFNTEVQHKQTFLWRGSLRQQLGNYCGKLHT